MTPAAEKICSAMLTLLQNKAFSEITVKELIATAEVSRSSYNYNFYSLQDVMDKIISRFSDGVISVMEEQYRKEEADSFKGDSFYNAMLSYIYEQREMLRILTRVGYLNRLRDSLTEALRTFFDRWCYVVTDAAEGDGLLREGLVFNLKNMENAYRIAADFMFWASYDYAIPADYYSDIIKQSRGTRLERPLTRQRRF